MMESSSCIAKPFRIVRSSAMADYNMYTTLYVADQRKLVRLGPLWISCRSSGVLRTLTLFTST